MLEQAIIIEKGIPIPESGTKTGKWKNVLNRMDIGDSFVIDLDKTDVEKDRVNKSSIVSNAATRLGMKIRTKRISNLLRIWRIQ